MTLVAALAVLALAAPLAARAQLSQLCPADVRTTSRATMHNEAKRTVAQIFDIAPAEPILEFATPDWTGGKDAVQKRVAEVLAARPRFLAPQIVWAEGADLRSDTFTALLRRGDGAPTRLTVSGYQVCVRDPGGEHWFFRNVAGDLWSD